MADSVKGTAFTARDLFQRGYETALGGVFFFLHALSAIYARRNAVSMQCLYDHVIVRGKRAAAAGERDHSCARYAAAPAGVGGPPAFGGGFSGRSLTPSSPAQKMRAPARRR
ncbi:hypothetical protein KCP69_06455 [Salmonella enterica subsp. enterica]|nr:hypothetical protein KCP69_06455 [Salmonella enterica subsp. enterica]